VKNSILTTTIAALAVAATACTTTATTSSTRPAPATTSSGSMFSSYAAAAAAPLPEPRDFNIGIKILRQQCFNYAGCNITFQIDPTYTGPGVLANPTRQLMVTYAVAGADSQIIDYFTVDNAGTAHFQREQFVSTKTQPVTLTAHATRVSVAN